MKKLILIIFLSPLFAFGQGLFLQNENGTYSNGDSISMNFYIQRFTLDFESQVLRFDSYLEKEAYVNGDTLTAGKILRYGMTLNDTIYIGGSPYSTVQVFNAIFTAGDLDVIKIVNNALIEEQPMRKYIE